MNVNMHIHICQWRVAHTLGFADGAMGVDGGRTLGLNPSLQTIEVHVFHRASALAKVDERVALRQAAVASERDQ